MVARSRRRLRLGELGEILAAEALRLRGFQNIRDLNADRHNQPFADLLAERAGRRYFIAVKTRNEIRASGKEVNPQYNCPVVPDDVNKELKKQGKTTDEITKLVHRQVHSLAAQFKATPAWITVPIRPKEGTYAVYFGLLADLGNRRSIPMKPEARKKYECLVDWKKDPRITPDLTNQR